MSSGKSSGMIYGIDDVPPLREGIFLGLQHYLTMFGSTVAIPLILADALGMGDDPIALGWLISTMFFVSGITTLIQTTWGNRLPLVQGGTFSFLTPAAAICGMAALANAGWEVRLQHLQGAIIAGAAFEILVGYTGMVGAMLRFVGPITIAPTIALIGLSLFEFGAPKAGGHWGVGGLTILLIILFSQFLRRRHRIFELFPILMGILLAWGVAAILTWKDVFPAGHPAHVSTDNLVAAPWVRIPTPFQWGMPVFGAAAIVGMLAGYVSSIVESVGDYFACSRMAGEPPPERRIINRGIGMEGIGCLIAGIFGTGNGTTSYSENIGAIGLTRVGSRRVVQIGALLMLVLACLGKFGALFTTIPSPVVGGMYCAMFGMIAAVGLSNLQFIDLNSARNLFILGFALFMGLSMPVYFRSHPVELQLDWMTGLIGTVQGWLAGVLPEQPATPEELVAILAGGLSGIISTIGQTGMAVGALFAFTLDNTIPGSREERGLLAWTSPVASEAGGEEVAPASRTTIHTVGGVIVMELLGGFLLRVGSTLPIAGLESLSGLALIGALLLPLGLVLSLFTGRWYALFAGLAAAAAGFGLGALQLELAGA